MSDQLFYWLSKIAWLLISPDSLLLILLLVGVVSMWFGASRLGQILISVCSLAFLAIAVFPVGEWLLYDLESRYPVSEPPENVSGVIMLSGAEDTVRTAVWGQTSVNGAAERDLAFMALMKRYPDSRFVFTGGNGNLFEGQHKAADIAEQLFREQGVDVSRIEFERDSRNTWENAIFSKELVVPKDGEQWLLVTSASHMPRAMGVFCKNEWPVQAYPVDFQTRGPGRMNSGWSFGSHLHSLVVAVKEQVGLLAYRLSDRSC